MSRISALALKTFREAIRNKVLYLLVLFAIGLIVLSVPFSQGALHEQMRVTRDVGLAGIELFGVLIAVFIGVNLVYKEVDRKTVFALIPKPIHRYELILGKFVGMLLTLAVMFAVMSLLMALVLRLQVEATSQPSNAPAIARAVALLFGEVTVVTAVAVLFSSFSTPILSGALTLGMTVVGHFTPELRELIARIGSRPMRFAVAGALRLFPDLNLFYVSGAMVSGQRVSVHGSFVDWGYVGTAALYGVAYSACALVLAMIVFSRRDFV
jgi:Cu-processing system permease protein